VVAANSPAATPLKKAFHSVVVNRSTGASGRVSLASRTAIWSPGSAATSTHPAWSQYEDLRKSGVSTNTLDTGGDLSLGAGMRRKAAHSHKLRSIAREACGLKDFSTNSVKIRIKGAVSWSPSRQVPPDVSSTKAVTESIVGSRGEKIVKAL
jgi:hypothetical protein